MNVPVKHRSHARVRTNRAHIRLVAQLATKCPDCGRPARSHRPCPHCGSYRGKPVLKIKTKDKKSRKR